MRTVITISLNGNAYQLDAVGYEALRAYLQVAEQRLAGNPDQMEILADLEQAIADKCGRYLGPHKNVVSSDEIAEVLREMGPVDGEAAQTGQGAGAAAYGAGAGAYGASGAAGTAGAPGAAGGAAQGAFDAGFGGGGAAGDAYSSGNYAGAAGTSANAAAGATSGSANPGGSGATGGTYSTSGSASTGTDSGEPARRLYQIREGAVISGVCKGLAAYLNIDVAIVRCLFILLAVLTGGAWILVYIVMMFVIPYAQTSEQHAAAHGWPFNAEELVARAKAHYAQFRENSGKWQRRQYREQRRMWKDQHKAWKDQQQAWERYGAAQGAPPPPPPPTWAGAPPANLSYSAQVLHGFLSPIVSLLGVILFFLFLSALISLVRHHNVFGWWLPHDIPLWLGIVLLVVLYRVVASPLHEIRYATYYGARQGQGLLAFIGALVWLGLLTFLGWLAWQHWPEMQDFFQDLSNSWHWMMERRSVPPGNTAHATALFMAWGVPSCVLPGYIAAGEFQSHGEVDGANVLGESTDGDVVDSGLGNGAYSLE
jgi:phage shock protein PspC (stress-responsive transcriptional regulator)